ncbi:MAG: DUF2461 domain-containing protein [Gemmatimonadales bacterium]
MASFDGFSPAAFRFFRGLARNNDKPWFEKNRPIYETEIRERMRALIEEMDVRLGEIAPEIIGDPRRSMFRINRDIRFSKDKSPYKTNAGCWFYHRDAGKRVGQEAEGGSAGFYFHFEPSGCFAAGGIWMPPRGSLAKIRDAIAEAPRTLTGIVGAPAFKRRFGPLDSEAKLTRVPRGYDPEHPAADYLKLQSFTVHREIEPAVVGSRRLLGRLSADFERMLPLVRWINAALGYRAAKSRI